ncbi:hypothetical protein SynSYN20_01064 [Synechococcus sp. SYN20]|nr:hypothetical protein SynSYN20_01064 [Synechococcus sp. SYN20]
MALCWLNEHPSLEPWSFRSEDSCFLAAFRSPVTEMEPASISELGCRIQWEAGLLPFQKFGESS